MDGISFKNIFTDFMKLSYNSNVLNNKYNNTVIDIMISEYSFVRISSKGYTIYYLDKDSGSINIPVEWINLFKSFNSEYEMEMKNLEKRINKNSDYIDKFGCMFNLLLKIIKTAKGLQFTKEANRINEVFEGISRIISVLSQIKTDRFIEWCESEFKVELRPFKVNTINNKLNF